MTDRETQIIRDLLTIISDVQRTVEGKHNAAYDLKDDLSSILDCGFAWNTIATAREITEGK